MAAVAFQHVAKVYPDGTRAVDGLTLEVGHGEFVVIVGPSGSGKPTALRMVAGPEGAVDAVVETTSLHFFDPKTGVGIYDGDKGTAGEPDIHQS